MTSTEKPMVSIIVPTYNSAEFIGRCLESIRQQTYEPIELIVVDNNSTDNTKALAKTFTKKVYNKGPERSAQRNYGVSVSQGEYVAIIDSDMELEPAVIEQAVAILGQAEVEGVVVPEQSFGEGFWARCKQLERSFYVGVPWMEAARIFRKSTFDQLGGYNTVMVSGEDWDLSQRAATRGTIGRTNAIIRHNEGRLKLMRTLRKKYYYAQKIALYLKNQPANASSHLAAQTSPLSRYKLYFSRPFKLFRNPILGLGMLYMKTLELAYGGLGYLKAGKQG